MQIIRISRLFPSFLATDSQPLSLIDEGQMDEAPI